MINKKILAIMMAATMLGSFAACSSNSSEISIKDSSHNKNYAVAPLETAAAAEMYYDGEEYGDEFEYEVNFASDGYSSTNVSFKSQKLIKRKYMTIETLDFDKTITAINDAVKSSSGYVESSNVSGTSEEHNRYAEYCFRVPASQYENCSDLLNKNEIIILMNESTDDVTSEYTDIEAHLVALRTEYDTLISLVEQATDLETILILQNELSNVRYEIEYYEGNKRLYDDLVSYSTITVTVREIEEEAEEEEPEAPTFKERVKEAFDNMKEDTRESYENYIVNLVSDLPSVIMKVVFFLIVLIVIIVVLVKRNRKKKAMDANTSSVKEDNKNEVCNSESNKSTGNGRSENNGEN